MADEYQKEIIVEQNSGLSTALTILVLIVIGLLIWIVFLKPNYSKNDYKADDSNLNIEVDFPDSNSNGSQNTSGGTTGSGNYGNQ